MGRVIDVATQGASALPVGPLVAAGTAVFAVAGGAAFARTVLIKVRRYTQRRMGRLASACAYACLCTCAHAVAASAYARIGSWTWG
jgi:hypothetical protein